jgi:hypothetical protein
MPTRNRQQLDLTTALKHVEKQVIKYKNVRKFKVVVAGK